MPEMYVTALIKCNELQAGGGYWRKYRKVVYTREKLQRLVNYLNRERVDWSHINLYDRDTRVFVKQIKKK